MWDDPAALTARADRPGPGQPLVQQLTGPLNPTGIPAGPASCAAPHDAWPGRAAAAGPPPSAVPARLLQRLPGHGPARQRRRPDGPVLTGPSRVATRPAGRPGRRAADARRVDRSPRRHGAVDSCGLVGDTALATTSAHLRQRPLRIIPIALRAIGLLLALVLRSLVAPLYLIASVGPSYLAALGLSVLMFIDIGGRRPDVHPAVPDVHLPAGPRRGLQHPDDVPDPGGGPDACPARCGRPGAGRDRRVTSAGWCWPARSSCWRWSAARRRAAARSRTSASGLASAS